MVLKKPEWMKIKVRGSGKFMAVEDLLSDLNLNTVCVEANCPNKMECYERKTSTFMILGANCTRNCKYCNVTCARPEEVDPKEPRNLATAVDRLKLKHAVVTSVTRDDLEDEGANQFAEVIREIRKLNSEVTVEVLIPDLHAKKELLDIIFVEKPEVLNHNIEAVRSIFKTVRPQGDYERSLDVLKQAKESGLVTKSGFMVGLGETKEEVFETLEDLRSVDCDMVTIGQYLQPTKEHFEVQRYVTPEEFDEYKARAYELGFKHVASGPFVRSSYHAQAL
ncbi:lipoyl synthase [Gallicola sp. Sow4_E12]|uniref:lipoyl synthase n=1 Tax=Gallicola sp. Sow4_E12 TaxID=3438785 RepID=UPI003F938851